MNIDNWITDLNTVLPFKSFAIQTNVNLKKKTSLGIGGTAALSVIIHQEEALSSLFSYLHNKHIPFFILGKGSNLLCDDSFFNGTIIQLGDAFKDCSLRANNTIVCGASAMDSKLASFASMHNLGDLAFLATIPGTLGGGVYMNAGAYGYEIKDSLLWVETWNTKTNQLERFTTKELHFKYRFSFFHENKHYLILRACFQMKESKQKELQQKAEQWIQTRKTSQPSNKKTCGSLFTNPKNNFAGKLIEECGLKGYKIGGACISSIHANFIENYNNASFQDVYSLIKLIKMTILEQKGISLQLEGEILFLDKIQSQTKANENYY